ncbi:MAG TPA: hypothetical protein VEZ46_12400 [Mycobacteriales bacterium]|nr:hypothetical protein [Mycobacteriales bacterium]
MSEGPIAPGSAHDVPEPDLATGLGRGTLEPVEPAGDDFLAPNDDGESMGE